VQPSEGVDPEVVARRESLLNATREVLELAIQRIKPGMFWSEIALSLERRTSELGFGLVHEYVGHGIGASLHEPPKVPAYWTGFTGVDFVLRPGMVLAIEPLLAQLPPNKQRSRADRVPPQCPVLIAADGWTVHTSSGMDACHEEAMVAVTDSGAKRLTPKLW
jgi:methionyl aminopeptidase